MLCSLAFSRSCCWPARPAGQEGKADPNPIFRLSVSLVQLDAVVTDRKGHHVTDLGPSDFLVMQDGRPQPVTAVAYVRADEHLLDDTGTPIVLAADVAAGCQTRHRRSSSTTRGCRSRALRARARSCADSWTSS